MSNLVFISLTRVPRTENDTEPVLLQPAHIIAMMPNPQMKNAGSEVVLTTGDHLFVTETPDEILRTIVSATASGTQNTNGESK